MSARPPLLAALLLSAAAHAAPTPREAAQRGLDFLGQNTIAWQQQNRCYGCHVQAVTLDGLAVGVHNQYRVPRAVLDQVLSGMLTLPGGARTPTGLSHPGFPRTAKTFGAQAFARYDAWVDTKVTDELLKLARELLPLQQKDGAVVGDHQSYPVTTGPVQATFQAATAWRQAYARTADDAWLPPLRLAEGYLARTAKAWQGNPASVYLQDVNYAVLGLLAAGAPGADGDVARLVRFLESKQGPDGGWGFGAASDAYATGQTVATLRQAGRGADDRVVARGLAWLVQHQAQDGGWGAAGSARAEALWAVLGLVSVDVLSISVAGVVDGERVLPTQEVTVEAKDNQGAAVKSVELRLDDLVVKTQAGGRLTYTWATKGLKDGLHTVDVLATNAGGRTSRRRLEVYAGNLFLTQLGSRYTDEGTQLTLRDLAPEGTAGQVVLRVFPDEGAAAKGPVFSSTQAARHGATAFVFGGKGQDGKPFAPGRYRAELAFADASGREVQNESLVFVHASPEAQRARYAEIEGKLELARDGDRAANAEVELVDDQGRTVQKVKSNAEGQYRFKSVSGGQYHVRFKKDGFAADEKAVQASAGAPAAPVNSSFR
jgi:Carboxypeptidase regulatory-like domain/Squalene-hopene cyclase C-terminal domain/Bacterial Ig domain